MEILSALYLLAGCLLIWSVMFLANILLRHLLWFFTWLKLRSTKNHRWRFSSKNTLRQLKTDFVGKCVLYEAASSFLGREWVAVFKTDNNEWYGVYRATSLRESLEVVLTYDSPEDAANFLENLFCKGEVDDKDSGLYARLQRRIRRKHFVKYLRDLTKTSV